MANDEPAATRQELATLADRRRPGRPATVNPELLPLLRGQWRAPPPRQERRNPDDLHAMRGVLLAVLASAAFWLALVVMIRQ